MWLFCSVRHVVPRIMEERPRAGVPRQTHRGSCTIQHFRILQQGLTDTSDNLTTETVWRESWKGRIIQFCYNKDGKVFSSNAAIYNWRLDLHWWTLASTSAMHLQSIVHLLYLLLLQMGIDNDTEIVVYDNNPTLGFYSAGRVWWMFKVCYNET